jgi:DNA-directed RNA polymerase specialized sigma24 family protein
MSPHPPLRPEDVPHVPDEDLAVRARDRRAQDELFHRHLGYIDAVAHCLALALGVPRSDWEDAEQVGRLAILEAIADYRDVPPGPEREGRFRHFLGRVARRRLHNLARGLRRYGHRFVQPAPSRPAGTAEDAEPAAPSADPAQLAERREAVERLRRELERLEPWQRRLVESLASDDSLLEVAEEMHLTYAVAKRRRQRLVELLQRTLTLTLDSRRPDGHSRPSGAW